MPLGIFLGQSANPHSNSHCLNAIDLLTRFFPPSIQAEYFAGEFIYSLSVRRILLVLTVLTSGLSLSACGTTVNKSSVSYQDGYQQGREFFDSSLSDICNKQSFQDATWQNPFGGNPNNENEWLAGCSDGWHSAQ